MRADLEHNLFPLPDGERAKVVAEGGQVTFDLHFLRHCEISFVSITGSRSWLRP